MCLTVWHRGLLLQCPCSSGCKSPNSWKRCVWLGFSLSIVHCAGRSAAACFYWAAMSFQWEVVVVVEVYRGTYCPPFFECLFWRSCQNIPWTNSWDALRARAEEERRSSSSGSGGGGGGGRKWTACRFFFLSGPAWWNQSWASGVKMSACCWWQAVGKTSLAQHCAVPLGCSCSSPAVACVLDCGQTAACDSLPCVMWEGPKMWWWWRGRC